MSDAVLLEAFNVTEVQEALADAPLQAYRYIRQEHRRFATRTRKGFIKARMSGPPGINWGHGRNAKKVGGNVLAKAKDEGTILSMRVWFRISRFLAKHETGGTIYPTRGQALAIRLPSAKNLPHKPSGALEAYGQHPFLIPGTNLLAVSVAGQLVPLYSLHRSIRIPARLGFRAFVAGQLGEFKQRTLAAAERGIRVAMEKRVKTIGRTVERFAAA